MALRPLRLACWNVEWFDRLFGPDDDLMLDGAPARRYGLTRAEQGAAVGAVMRALEADALLVVEAPNMSAKSGRTPARALARFAEAFGLRQSAALAGFESETDQELALIYDPAVVAARHDPKGGPPQGLAALEGAGFDAPRFDGERCDAAAEGRREPCRFLRPPLEVALTPHGGREIRLIGAHLKSKGGPADPDPEDERERRLSSRRRQLMEARWIRARVEEHLSRGEDVIVLGDLNDGPGLDLYERGLGASSLDVIMGAPPARLTTPHARTRWTPERGWSPASARFYDAPSGGFINALIDFILASPGLAPRGFWRIWNPFQDEALARDPALAGALRRASDHYPVTLDLALDPPRAEADLDERSLQET